MKNATQNVSTRPYLIRALFEWCNDNALTPYIAVKVDQGVQVPKEYVQNGEIVLNISLDATSGLQLGNEFVEFKARFGGTPRQIVVPVGQVIAIYAKENGQGMAFPAPPPVSAEVEPNRNKDLAKTESNSLTPSPLTLMKTVASPKDFTKGEQEEVPDKNSGDELSDSLDTNQPPTPPATPPAGRPKLTRIK